MSATSSGDWPPAGTRAQLDLACRTKFTHDGQHFQHQRREADKEHGRFRVLHRVSCEVPGHQIAVDDAVVDQGVERAARGHPQKQRPSQGIEHDGDKTLRGWFAHNFRPLFATIDWLSYAC